MALQSSDLENPFECKDSENYGSPPSLCMLTTLSEIPLSFSQRERGDFIPQKATTHIY